MKINDDCINIFIDNNTTLININISEYYQLNSVGIRRNTNLINKYFLCKYSYSIIVVNNGFILKKEVILLN